MGLLCLNTLFTDLAGEQVLVVKLIFHPGHQQLDVLGSRHFERSFNILPIRPQVLEFLARTHHRTGVLSTEFGQCAIQDRNFVIELDSIHSQPLIEILTRR